MEFFSFALVVIKWDGVFISIHITAALLTFNSFDYNKNLRSSRKYSKLCGELRSCFYLG